MNDRLHRAPALAFLTRRPVLDRRGRLAGQTLACCDAAAGGLASQGRDGADPALLEGLRIIANLTAEFGLEGVLGDGMAFLRADAALLASDFVELPDPPRTVLLLSPGLSAEPWAMERLEALGARGFRFGLDDAFRDTCAVDRMSDTNQDASTSPWLPYASFVRVHASRADSMEAAGIALRSHGARLIATGVDDASTLMRLAHLDIELHEGTHFARPEVLSARTIAPAYMAVLEALSLVQQDVPTPRIEQALKADPALMLKLLRYINSAGFGTSRPISSVGEAIAWLGYRPLVRWLGLMLVTADGAAPHVLSRTALTRGRTLELLLEKDDVIEADQGFMTGLFSLLDVMLGMPMPRVMEKLPLPDEVMEALVSRGGRLGALLMTVEACESAHDARQAGLLAAASERARVSPEDLNGAHWQALAWAQQFGS